MNANYLGRIILFGTLLLGCLMILQVYWFKKAFNVAEMQFDHSVQVALKKVADSVSSDSEVKKLSSNFYFVATESKLNDKALDSLLKKELLLRSLNVDYELGVYKAEDDTLVYGHYVEASKRSLTNEEFVADPAIAGQKNFAVYFPRKESYVAAQLTIWIFSTVVLLLMMGFFAFAIYSLLRERKFAALKSDFINNMTHEFKTPVTNIKIATEIIRNKANNPAMNIYLDILMKENEKLRQKIDHVLLGSSADHLKRPALEIINVHQLMRECADAFQWKVQQRQGNIVLELHAENSTVLADRELLAQAINNIIDNAEKYSPARPRITLATKDGAKGIEISILDEGIGIASSMKTKVFEKFFRVRSGDADDVKGFGLGLSFVKNVIRSHRGKVHLFSDLSSGTEVRIILPAYG